MNQDKVLKIALEQYGTLEIVGPKHNAEVVKYYAKSGNSWVKDDETAWCAAFVGYCLETAGITSTKKLNARSYLKWGKKAVEPKLGDIVVFWRIYPTSSYGHVAFFIKKDKNYIWVLGGNQSDSVNISKYLITQLLEFRTY